jgi:DcrB-like protein
MTFSLRCFAIGLVVLACAGSSAVAQPKYELRRPYAFAVGTVVQSRETALFRQTLRRNSDNTVVKEMTTSRTERVHTEVLEVNEQGQPVTLLHHIQKDCNTTRTSDAAGQAESNMVELRDIRYRSKKDGLYFKPDVSTLTASAGTSLTEPQIEFLREKHIENLADFAIRPPEIVALLPREAVSVGEDWTPTTEALKEFVRSHPDLQKAKAEIQRARFALEQVEDGVARVVGSLEMTMTEGGVPVPVRLEIWARITLENGLWNGWGVEIEACIENQGVAVSVSGRIECSVSMVTGTGKVSQPPRGLAAIHLPLTGLQPDGTYVNSKLGLRIELPRGYQEFPAGVKGPVIAAFTNDVPYKINLSGREFPEDMTLEEYASKVSANVAKRLPQYEVVKQETVELPGKIPGCLITARFQGGRGTLLSLLVIRKESSASATYFGITAGVATRDTEHLAMLRDSFLTTTISPRPPK